MQVKAGELHEAELCMKYTVYPKRDAEKWLNL